MTEKARNAVHPKGVRTGAGAANCLSVGQRHLCDNPLLKEPLTLSHIKTMVLGHRGTTPRRNVISVHLNRVLDELDRSYLVQDVVDPLAQLGTKGAYLRQLVQNNLVEHKHYIARHGRDLPAIHTWMWQR